jgi:hypothetical protein
MQFLTLEAQEVSKLCVQDVYDTTLMLTLTAYKVH